MLKPRLAREDGRLAREDGRLAREDGRLAREDGRLAREDGRLAREDGRLAREDGRLARKDGRLAREDGRLAREDGRLAREDGRLAREDGRLAREDGLQKALALGLYLIYFYFTLYPLDFLKLLWPDCLCEHIAGETNEYARQVKAKNWVDTSEEEVWVFLGIVMEMGIHRVPKIVNYWSRNPLLGIVPVKQAMSLNRFKALWRYLHCDDNKGITDSRDMASKVKTVVEVLGRTFLANYHPSQELSVDEMMVKYKGKKGGKIRMPNKPVKLGFKVWSTHFKCS